MYTLCHLTYSGQGVGLLVLIYKFFFSHLTRLIQTQSHLGELLGKSNKVMAMKGFENYEVLYNRTTTFIVNLLCALLSYLILKTLH